MFKKSLIMALVLVTGTQSFAAITTEEGDSLLTRFQKQVFEGVYFGTFLLPFSYVAEFTGRLESKRTVVGAQDDAIFFKEHVASAQKDEYGNIYKKVVVQVQPGEIVTQLVLTDANKSNARHEVVIAPADGQIVFDDYTAAYVKINGRILISDKLEKAHEAATNMIFSEQIEVPVELRTGENKENTYQAAKNAVVLNQLMLDFVNHEQEIQKIRLQRTR